jgi:ABC-type glutathione transport system ATPase component
VSSESKSQETVLSVRGLCVSYPDAFGNGAVIDNLQLELKRGQIIGICGASGSGKSTLAQAILKTVSRNAIVSGEIEVRAKRPVYKNGVPVNNYRHGSDVAFFPQEPWSSLNPAMSISRQFKTALVSHHPTMTSAQVDKKTTTALSDVGLNLSKSELQRYPHEFSGGELQRITIALGLLHEPTLLIADEPTSSLDSANANRVLRILTELCRKNGTAGLIISHREAELFEYCDVVYRLGADGRLEQILAPNLRPEPPKPLELPMNPKVLVSLESLALAPGGLYGRQSKEKVSFSISERETVSLVGPSGAGKTTVARKIVGLAKVGSGNISVLGVDLQKSAMDMKTRARLAMIFQDSSLSLNPLMSIGDQVAEPIRSHNSRMTKAQLRIEAKRLLEEVGLGEVSISRKPNELSGGQRQRVNIARAMALAPLVVVADEPTSSLDSVLEAEILTLLRTLQAKHGFGLLFISHDSELAKGFANKVVSIGHGKEKQE